MKKYTYLLLFGITLLCSFTGPVKYKFGVLIAERRNASSAIKWENVTDGDTLHYYNYSSKEKGEEVPRFLMYSFYVFKGEQLTSKPFALEVTHYKQQDSVAQCTGVNLPQGQPFVCTQSQLDITSQHIRISDAEGNRHTIVLMLDGNLKANKNPFAFYDY